MQEDFTVTPMFPDAYRDFIAEICYRGTYLCTITQEFGPLDFSVEFEKSSPQVPLKEFMEAVEHAKRRLYELREADANQK